MDLGKLVQMIVNIVLRRAVNFGVNKGIDMAVRKGSGKDTPMTAPERQAAKQARQAVKRARQAAAITRRMK